MLFSTFSTKQIHEYLEDNYNVRATNSPKLNGTEAKEKKQILTFET